MRVVVTGGTGFIGSHLVRALVDRGDEVTLLTRATSDPWRLADVRPKITLVPVELEDRIALERILTEVRPELVFHLGMATGLRHGSDVATTAEYLHQNLAALTSLVEVLHNQPRPPHRMVRTGTIAEYGFGPVNWRETDAERPSSAYGATLLAGTRFIATIANNLAFPVRTARPALTYGPMQSSDFLVPVSIEACQSGHALHVKRPDDKRDFIYVDDLVRGLLRFSRVSQAPTVLNFGSSVPVSARDLALKIADISNTGRTSEITFGKSQDPTCLSSNGDLCKKTLGWTPQIPLANGLRRTSEWFAKQKDQVDLVSSTS